jgi:hypothetical protein
MDNVQTPNNHIDMPLSQTLSHLFAMPMNIVQLIKICLNEACSKLHVAKHLRTVLSSGKRWVREDIPDWKDLGSAVVVWRLRRITKVLQLFAVKSNTWPINSVINPKPVSSHEHATVLKKDFKDMWWECVDWILMAQDRDEWQAVGNGL